jgi:hypothetical protein
MRGIIAGAILLASSVSSLEAAESAFLIGPRIGPGEVRVTRGVSIGDHFVDATVEEETIGIGGTLEFRAPFGLVIEGGLFASGSIDWFDSEDYRLSEYFASLGYHIELGNGFSITPRVGRLRWKLESDETWFFDFDEEANPAIRGYEDYWEITALKSIGDRVSLGVSHRENDYEFGRARTTVFTALFNL